MSEFPPKPRIAIIGAGAIGCYYGARLVQHGQDVHFLMRSDYEHVRRHGMSVKSHAGDFVLAADQLHIYRASADMPKADLVIVALKTTSNALFPELISPLLHDSTAILTLQNGLGNEQQLADHFGPGRTIGGLAFVCINRLAAGVISHTDYGLIKIGEFAGPISPRLRAICDMFNASKVPCELLEDLAMGRWEKLIWNVPFNALGAAMGLTTDRIVSQPEGIALVRDIMREVVAIAHADGVMLDEALIEQNINKTLTMGAYRSSMQIDQELGRPIEHEGILGQPLAVADRHGVDARLIRMLYQQLCLVAHRRK